MTQSTKGPENVPGENDQNKHRDDPMGSNATKGQSPVQAGQQGTHSSECATKGAPNSGSQGMKSGGDCSTSNSSKSQASHDAPSASGECCDPKSASPAQHADSGRANVPAQAKSTPMTSPQDPKQFGTNDPVQPRRSEPIQPSRVAEPAIGAADASGDES